MLTPTTRRFAKCISCLSVLVVTHTALAQNAVHNNSWYANPTSTTVIVFVHGIFSNSRDCWTSSNGVFWPALVRSDRRFGNPAIYLGGYYTDLSSGIYRVPDAAAELLQALRLRDVNDNPSVMDKPNIIFVAHSAGGLVVRYLLERNRELFRDKSVGLVLLASPSRGSAWANRLRWLRDFYGNKMSGELARDNDFIMDLDSRFSDLVAKHSIPKLSGVDAFESKFIVPGIIFNTTHVVSAADSTSYFGASRIVPDSDHFTIAKPTSLRAPSHLLLLDFFTNGFKHSASAEATLSVRVERALDQPNALNNVRGLLSGAPELLEYIFLPRPIGTRSVLTDLLIQDVNVDFVLLAIQGPMSNSASEVTLVKLLEPSADPNGAEATSVRRRLQAALRNDGLTKALKNRHHYRGYLPDNLYAGIVICGGRRSRLRKTEVEKMGTSNAASWGNQVLTYDSVLEALKVVEHDIVRR